MASENDLPGNSEDPKRESKDSSAGGLHRAGSLAATPHSPSLLGSGSTIDRFFRGISECIFHSKLGVVDVQLVDYVSDLLLRFTRTDATTRMRRANGRPITEVFQMLDEAEKRFGLAKREVHRHIGDFTLFWSGMYPEGLRKVQSQHSPDVFLDYCRQGKRAYAIAAEIEGGKDRPSCEVLHRMSEHFEMCAYGLREVRREWEENPSGDDHLLA